MAFAFFAMAQNILHRGAKEKTEIVFALCLAFMMA
jgi:hypothetical protein